MGQDIGFIAVAAPEVAVKTLASAAHAAWQSIRGLEALVMTVHGPLRLPPPGGVIRVVTFFAQPADVAGALALEGVARAISRAMGARAAAAFMADHYCLGGFQVFDRGRREKAALLRNRYTEGSLRALERLGSCSIPLADGDRLFFTESWIWDHCEGTSQSHRLAADGCWLRSPLPVELSEDERDTLTQCYAIHFTKYPDVAPTLSNTSSWRGAVQDWARDELADGAEVFSKEGWK